MKIKTKIPLSIIGSLFITTLIVTMMTVYLEKNAYNKNVFLDFEASLASYETDIKNYFDCSTKILTTLSDIPCVVDSIQNFNLSWKAIDGNKKEILQKLYIGNNSFPEGQRSKFLTSDGNLEYDLVHKSNHPYLSKIVTDYGFYDLFLINMEGDVIYSNSKEYDFATNLLTDNENTKPLADTFNKIKNLPKGGVYYSDFSHYKVSNNEPFIFAGVPVYENNKIIGALIIQINHEHIDNSAKKLGDSLGKSAMLYLVGPDYLARNNVKNFPNKTLLTTTIKNEAVERALRGESVLVSALGADDGAHTFVKALPFKFGDNIWALAIEMDKDEIYVDLNRSITTIALINLTIILIISAFGYYLAASITSPINTIIKKMSELAKDNTNIDITESQREDEIGEMGKALLIFKENTVFRQQKTQEDKLQAERQVVERKNLMATIAQKFQEKVKSIIEQLIESSHTMIKDSQSMVNLVSSVSKEIGGTSETLQTNLTYVNSIASSIEELFASIKEISSQTSSSNKVVSEAVTLSNNANDAADNLATTTNKIQDIVVLINEISEQINLLSLNATIEAARAGEAGQGFAVVAGEIKQLVSQTSKATDEISKKITDTKDASGGVVKALGEIKNTILNINNYASGIAAAVEEQTSTAKDISERMNSTASNTKNVNETINKIILSASEATESTNRVMQIANNLLTEENVLLQEVDKFLSELKNS